MACFFYVPKAGLTLANAQNYINGTEAQICFKIEAPQVDYQENRDEQFALDGTPCFTSISETARLSIDSVPISVKRKPEFWEFARSTHCSELRIDHKTLPTSCMRLSDTGVRVGSFDFNVINKLYFSVSFTIYFWEMRA